MKESIRKHSLFGRLKSGHGTTSYRAPIYVELAAASVAQIGPYLSYKQGGDVQMYMVFVAWDHY